MGAVVAWAALFPADMSAGGRRYRGGCDNVGEAGCCTHNICETAVRNPITQVYSLDTGGVTAYSSYLSPMRYSGWGVALSGEWSKNLKQNPDKIQMTFAAKLDCSSLLNPANQPECLERRHTSVGVSLRSGARLAGGISHSAGCSTCLVAHCILRGTAIIPSLLLPMPGLISRHRQASAFGLAGCLL